MGKFCSQCGKPLNEGAAFCTHCGTAAAVNPQPVQQPQYRQQPVLPKKQAYRRPVVFRIISLILICVLAVSALWKLAPFTKTGGGIITVSGQPYAGLAVTITGENFGCYDTESCRVSIDGIDTPIISWGDGMIIVLVPENVGAGEKEIKLTNSRDFGNRTVKAEFFERKRTELARETLFADENRALEGDGYTLVVPAGSISENKEIIINRFDIPAVSESLYYEVVAEYEITNENGAHVVFDNDVYFWAENVGADETYEYQIFNEFEGIWQKTDFVYSEETDRQYLITDHFSLVRKIKTAVNDAVNTASNIYDETKTYINDSLNETFYCVDDAGNNVRVYYRESDAKKDASIPKLASDIAAAYGNAYNKYTALFGAGCLPQTRAQEKSYYFIGDAKEVTTPIRIYIDPRYNKYGAVTYPVTTGNIVMPSVYRNTDEMKLMCAHELFHLLQNHTLGTFKNYYMGSTRYKDLIDGIYTGNTTDVYRIFANNKWYLEATAEYAGLYIGTDLGIGRTSVHNYLEAISPYYQYDSRHEYGMADFLEYILNIKQPDTTRDKAFKEMWNYVKEEYSYASSVNIPFDKYVFSKTGLTAAMCYVGFWEDLFTRSFMPTTDVLIQGTYEVNIFRSQRTVISAEFKKDGVGVFVLGFTNPELLLKDDAILTRSFWIEAGSKDLYGEVFKLKG